MVDLRRVIGVVQIMLGILLILATAYFSNMFAVSHIAFTENASSHFKVFEHQGREQGESVPEYATIHTNYILLSNLYLMLLLNFGISTLLVLLAIMMILQGLVNKFAVPALSIGYKPVLWLALIGLLVVFALMMITQYFMSYSFS